MQCAPKHQMALITSDYVPFSQAFVPELQSLRTGAATALTTAVQVGWHALQLQRD